jgi:hypothetical protein
MIDKAFLSAERQRSERFMGITFALMSVVCLILALAFARSYPTLGIDVELATGIALAFLITAIANAALLFLWDVLARHSAGGR